MDEDVDEEMQQLGSSSKPQGVAAMPPSWRKSPMVSSRDSSSTSIAAYSSRDGSSTNSAAPSSRDEDKDEEVPQLRDSGKFRQQYGSSTNTAAYSSRDGSSNGSKQGQQHLPPGSVVNDIVPMKSKIPGGSAAAAAAAEQRKVQQAEQTANVQ
jgi:hypothetical protein